MGAGWRRFAEKVNTGRLNSSASKTWQLAAVRQPGRATNWFCATFVLQSKQKWNITTEKAFVSTSNARNEAMLREAGDFANHLKRCEKDIRSLKDATKGQLKLLKFTATPSRGLKVLWSWKALEQLKHFTSSDKVHLGVLQEC